MGFFLRLYKSFVKDLNIQRKIIHIIGPVFSLLLVVLTVAFILIFYKQYSTEQEQNHRLLFNSYKSLVKASYQELAYLSETITRDSQFIKTVKCYVKLIENKNINRCAKKIKINVEDVSSEEIKNQFLDSITSNGNNINNNLIGRNEDVDVFDLVFKDQVLWRQGIKDFKDRSVKSALYQSAKEEKKTKYGVEKDINKNYYVFGTFSHFNPKEYYFSRVGINFKRILRDLAKATNSEMIMFDSERIYLNEETEKKLNAFDFSFADIERYDVQNWHVVHRIEFSLSGSESQFGEFFLVKDAKTELISNIVNFVIVFVVISLLLVLSSFLITLIIKHIVVKPLEESVNLAKEIESGVYESQLIVESTDEVGQLVKGLNQMSEELKRQSDANKNNFEQMQSILKNVDLISKTLFDEASKVSKASETLSNETTRQSSALVEISATITDVSNNTKSNSKRASEANQNANVIQELLNQGETKMKEMESAMSEINDSSLEIFKIIKTINEIAFQTNLLALNASVEAARAGKFGKGFAVVANEVKNLAERSAQSANDTNILIENSLEKAKLGNEVVNQTSEDMKKIFDTMLNVLEPLNAISEELTIQSSSLGNMEKAISEIEQINHRNASNSQGVASTAKALFSELDKLRKLFNGHEYSANFSQDTETEATGVQIEHEK